MEGSCLYCLTPSVVMNGAVVLLSAEFLFWICFGRA